MHVNDIGTLKCNNLFKDGSWNGWRDEYLQYIWAKGQGRIKMLQAQMNEGEKRRKQGNVFDAKRVMEAADLEEKMLRNLYSPTLQEIIDVHTSIVIGELTRIE